MSNVAYTLARRRKHDIAIAAVVRDREQAVTVLRRRARRCIRRRSHADGERYEATATTSNRARFLFPGRALGASE